MGSAQVNISSKETVESIPIHLPNLNMQKKIIQDINYNITKIDKTITQIKIKIELLEEYKISLIQNIVTGKIDIKEVKL